LPTSIGTDSKAALGYKLLDDSPVRELEQYQQNLTENRQHEAEVFATLLTSMLHDFQLFSAEIRRQYNNILANNINQVLSDLVKNVASFKHHFPCLSLDSIQIELKILLTDWSSVALQYDKNAAGNLLTRAQTTQLQLDIAQCLVEQPWSSID
jgi:triphosphatase